MADATSSGSPPNHEPTPAPARRIFLRLDRTARAPYPRREYVRKLLWRLVQATCIRWSLPGAHRWRRWCLRRFGADMTGEIRRTTTVWHPWLFRIGRFSLLSDHVVVYNLGEVSVGEHTVVSQDVYLCAGTHDHTRPDLPLVRATIRIGSGVWICAGAFIGPGVTIGDNCIVGARAVVMKDVPPGVIVAGNPARIVSERPMPDVDLPGAGRSDYKVEAARVDEPTPEARPG